MKLYSVLDLMNQNEKGRFVNILSSLISETDEQLTKKTDTEAFVGTFNTPKITAGYSEVVRRALRDDIKLDIAADIFMADGNGFMSRDSLAMKYKKKQEELKTSVKELEAYMDDEKNASNSRVRDYQIYAACLSTAAVNDMEHQAAGQISFDELTVINTLRHALELSDIEARALWLKYSNEDVDILVDDLISSLVSKGICFYKRSSMMIYIPDEFVRILRNLRGLRLPFKYQRRIFNALDDRMLNNIIKKYRIHIDKANGSVPRKNKINAILNQYIDIEHILSEDIFSAEDGARERKDKLADIIENRLKLKLEKQGRSLDERIGYLISYYNNDEQDGSSSLSKDGYNKLLADLIDHGFENQIREDFMLYKEISIDAQTLLDLLIKPKDILYLFSQDELETFSLAMGFKVIKKEIINSILAAYVNAEDKLIENYVLIASNKTAEIKNADLGISSGEVGVKFEATTKKILTRIGIEVSEKERELVGKEKPDIILKFDRGIFIGECKSSRKPFSKFALVTRQIGSYIKAYEKKGYTVLGALLFSDVFTDDFVQNTLGFFDYNLCLVKAEDLKTLYDEFRDQDTSFPAGAFTNQGLFDINRTIKALKR